jgi:hypothetical protein
MNSMGFTVTLSLSLFEDLGFDKFGAIGTFTN